MKLTSEFFRLPLQFDSQRLIDEVLQFSESDWRLHPQGHQGNTALPLLAANGDPANEDTRGAMLPTPHLAQCPYIQQVLATLGAPIGRTRLMRIAGHGEATAHVDTNYYWSQRVRVHIPVLTYPGVRFLCGEHEVFMDAGECWIFDTWRTHNVLNPDDRPRIHLVADTVGSADFWRLVDASDRPHLSISSDAPRQSVAYIPGAPVSLACETMNFPQVMSPWEVQWVVDQICTDLILPHDPVATQLREQLQCFIQDWRALWARYGERTEGKADFRAQLERLERDLVPLKGKLRLTNQVDPIVALNHWLGRAAVAPDSPKPSVARQNGVPPVVTSPLVRSTPIVPAMSAVQREQPAHGHTRFDRPVFIVAAPRSGSSLLFETLARAANLYTVGGESHGLFERIPALTPAAHGFHSNSLTAMEATPEVVTTLQQAFWQQLRDRDGVHPSDNQAVRLLEKTPKNALRIPFLAAAFPGARFIYLYREPEESLASIIEAWASGKFVTYPKLPGWDGPPWSLLLPPGWRDLIGKPVAQVAALQWEATNRQIMDDLTQLPDDCWSAVRYAQLLADPQAVAERLCQFAGLVWDQQLEQQLPLSRHTLTAPQPGKWQKHREAIALLLPTLTATAQRAQQLIERECVEQELQNGVDYRSLPTPVPIALPTEAADVAPNELAPLRSIHTISIPKLLQELGISVFASTYQAGRLVLLRADGDVLNTHFQGFNKPMGMALRGNRLAIGTNVEIREFSNVPANAARLEPADKHDACFMPRRIHTTGDIQIHEMAWAGDELWFVNTRFSCLCTSDPDYSFVPRWRPAFISALAPEDRCHLNGLAMVDGRPRFVTALGETDTQHGWREGKRDGGVLIDIAHNTVVARGLSMPHSPRWYGGQLWVLNSGEGGVGVVDPTDGRYREIARLPGFTRGIDFFGRYAFVGLSQVRESAVFSGIEIANLPVEQRACGIWVIDITTGQTVGFVKFEDALQEIFAVQVMPGLRFPDIVTDNPPLIAGTFILPDEALSAVPVNLRQSNVVQKESA